jgi:hypothetical protein
MIQARESSHTPSRVPTPDRYTDRADALDFRFAADRCA